MKVVLQNLTKKFPNRSKGKSDVIAVNDFNLEILEKISCNKSAIDGGCVYTDGSFSLVSDSLLTHIPTDLLFLQL